MKSRKNKRTNRVGKAGAEIVDCSVNAATSVTNAKAKKSVTNENQLIFV